jgi:geranylgeranyl reductase family protein
LIGAGEKSPACEMMEESYDVIIIGAGPAGSTLAWELSRRKKKVLILEKEKFPRDKPCGGGLTAKAEGIISFDISHLIDSEIKNMAFTRKFGDEISGSTETPSVKIVRRREFDNFLVDKAKESGAELVQETKVEKIEEKDRRVFITAEDGQKYQGKILIGADGALGVTSQSISSENDSPFSFLVALKCEISIDSLKNYKGKASIDWGTVPSSYAWIFPQKDTLNIGVGGPAAEGQKLEEYLYQWLDFKNISRNNVKLIGHPLKCRTSRKTPISKGRIILIGEAAGLVDYWTGEGIYYAIKSAKIAAPIIEKYLGDENVEYLREYEDKVDREIMPELEGAYDAAKIFETYSWPIHKMAKRSRRLFKVGYEIIFGRKKYSDFKKVSNALKWITPGLK